METKNAELGEGAKVPHLSYIGDAVIGEHSNIGAATVTVNYDGIRKHQTVIGAHARTGADNMFVAPVEVGDGAYWRWLRAALSTSLAPTTQRDLVPPLQ